jgi:hypothetical protein
MGRLINRLTEAKIRTLITKPGKYHDGQDLYLQVTSPAVVSWIFRFPSNGRTRYQGLGRARARAQDRALVFDDSAVAPPTPTTTWRKAETHVAALEYKIRVGCNLWRNRPPMHRSQDAPRESAGERERTR